jgi:hypothetical protein
MSPLAGRPHQLSLRGFLSRSVSKNICIVTLIGDQAQGVKKTSDFSGAIAVILLHFGRLDLGRQKTNVY